MKQLYLKRLLLVTFCMLASIAGWALDYESFIVNDIGYKILSETDKTVAVTNYAQERHEYNLAEPEGTHANKVREKANYWYQYRNLNYKGDIVIPQNVEYDGISYTVTNIADKAFQNCDDLTSVSIPNSVTSIGTMAFNNCKKLATVILSNKLTSMGEYAFQDCQLLESINIPGTLKLIPEEAFENCFALASVTLGEGIEEIGNGAFYDTDALTEITIPASVKKIGRAPFYSHGNHVMKRMIIADSDMPLEFANNYTNEYPYGNECLTDNITLDYFYLGRDINRVISEEALVYNVRKVDIGSKVTTIDNNGFLKCADLTTVTLAKGGNLTSIGTKAFYNCQKLTSVDLGDKLISVGTMAFNNCQKLTSVDLGDKLTFMGEYAFQDCQLLESINIPGTLKLIPEEAFENCFALASVTLNEGIEEIGNGAFYDTDALTEITIPASVKKIGRAPFYCNGTHAMNRMIIADSDTPLEFANNKTNEYSYGNECLTDNITLDYFYLGRDINRVISEEALVYNVRKVDIGSKVTTINNNGFLKCADLTTVTLAKGGNLTSIGTKAFYNCQKLTSVDLGDKLTLMGEAAFRDCQLLESINIPGTLKLIPTDAFERCYALVSVTLGEGIEEICNGAFYNTSSLTEITIPASVKKIGRAPFYGSRAMKRMILSDSDMPLEFANSTDEYNYGHEYLTEKITMDYFYLGRDIIRIISENALVFDVRELEIGPKVTTLPDRLFYNCGGLVTVTGGENVATMGIGVYLSCGNLERATLGKKLKVLPESTFEGCRKLDGIVLPDGLEVIQQWALHSCNSLTELTIPASVKVMGTKPDGSNGYRVFYGNSAMKKLVIEDSDKPLRFIETNSNGGYFRGMNALETLYMGRNIVTEGVNQNPFTAAANIEFGSKVTEIGTYFTDVTATNVKVPWKTPITITDDAFNNATYKKAILYIPGGTLQAYTTADGWKKFLNVNLASFIVTGTATTGGTLQFADQIVTNGTLSTHIDRETDVTFNVIPNENYDFTSLIINDEPVNVTNGTYIYPNLLSDLDVVATFTIKPQFTIKATATGGTVSLDGKTPSASQSIKVYRDTDVTLTVAAAAGYESPKVVVNGTDITAQLKDNKLTLQNIQEAKTIVVTFQKQQPSTVMVSGTATAGGTLTLNGQSVTNGTKSMQINKGTNLTIQVKANAGYDFIKLTVNGKDKTSEVVDGKLTINNIQENQTIVATFQKQQPRDNKLFFASGLKAKTGTEFFLPIELDNVNAISGVQFDLYLPDGMQLGVDEYGDYNIELSERTSDRLHTVSARVVSNGALRIVVTSQQNAIFTGNSGTLLTLALTLESTMEAGDYEVKLKNIIMTDPEENRYVAPDAKGIISVTTFTRGDVNNDGFIDVADLAGLVRFILENAGANLVFEAADMDGSGKVEVNDYSALVNLILAQGTHEGSRRRKANADGQTTDNYLAVGEAVIEGEKLVTLPILMNNTTDICGFQFDLYLPNGIIVATDNYDAPIIDFGRTTAKRHSVSFLRLNNGALRILCSSINNDLFLGNSGAVLYITLTSTGTATDNYTVSLKNIVLTDPQATRYTAEDAEAELSPEVIDGISSLGETEERTVIYDLAGRRLAKTQRGVNIVNGRKVVIK